MSETRSESQLGENITLSREIGSNAVEMISNLVIRNTPSAVLELIANSYDADAKEVYVDYDAEKDKLAVRDDGSGMTPEDLKSFYRLGDSPKLAKPISPGGRTRIGKFGVATLLLKYLGKEYSLSTVREDLETIVQEKFDTQLTQDSEIPFVTKKVKSKPSGTDISITGLNFNEEGLNMRNLRRMIQWELPLIRGFNVHVNGEEVVPKSITNATEFRIDETGKKMGHVKGSIYFTGRSTKAGGIHVYVNGRRIGDPKSLLESYTNKKLLTDRVVGVLDADELEEAILFDRGRFRDDHPGYLELTETIRKALKVVNNYTEVTRSNNNISRVEGQRERMLDRVKHKLMKLGLEEITKDSLVEFSDDVPEGEPGFYDKESGALLLNEQHPRLIITQRTTPTNYEMHLSEAIIDTLALTRARTNGEISLEGFLKEKANIYSILVGEREEGLATEKIHRMVVYGTQDIAKNSRWSLNSVRHIIERGVLKEGENGDILGKDYLELDSKTNGLVPLHEILQEKFKRNTPNFLPKFEKIFGEIGSSAHPFVYNLGNRNAPCYFVEGSCANWFSKVLQSNDMDLRRKHANPSGVFEMERDLYFTLPGLAKRSEGLDLKGVSEVIDYAKKRGIPIEQKREGQGVRFNYGAFLTTLQYKRGNLDYEKT